MPYDMEDIVKWEALRANMRKRRMSLGLRQIDVAEIMGRSQDYVSNLENDPNSIPNLRTIWLWTQALGGVIEVEWKCDSPHDVEWT